MKYRMDYRDNMEDGRSFKGYIEFDAADKAAAEKTAKELVDDINRDNEGKMTRVIRGVRPA